MAFSKRYRRGYPVAILVGFKEDQAALWRVFSQVTKLDRTVRLNGYRRDSKALYNFHEAIVDALRPAIQEGVRSVIVASPSRTDYSAVFLKHVYDHHTWMMQGQTKAAFAEITGTAITSHETTMLTRTPDFRRIVGETSQAEIESLLELLEKRLNAQSPEPLVLYALEDIEDKIFSSWLPGKAKPEYLLVTDIYLAGSRQKGRIQRLMQVSLNRKVKTRTLKADSPAGKRLTQLGGIVCILQPG